VFRLAVDTPITLGISGYENGYTPNSFLWIVNNIYFQYYSLLIFIVCCVVMVVVSFATSAPPLSQIQGLTYGTVTEEQKRETRSSWGGIDVGTSVVVMVAILAAYLCFRG
jgi:solute:Na+ symporter, SSS family